MKSVDNLKKDLANLKAVLADKKKPVTKDVTKPEEPKVKPELKKPTDKPQEDDKDQDEKEDEPGVPALDKPPVFKKKPNPFLAKKEEEE